MRHQLRLFLVAVQFLTRVPVRTDDEFDPDWLNQSARYFPAVGLLLGLVATLVYATACAWLAPGPAAWLSIATTIFITGAFHEDGFADTCDGLGGSVTKQRALEIMKDSRIGAYGAVGVVVLLGIKASTLAALPVSTAAAALLLGHTASRAAAISLTWFLPYGGDVDHAKTKPLARISQFSLLIALSWVVVTSAGLALYHPAWGLAIVASLLGVAVVALGCGHWFQRRLGGFTGDTLGATQQACEAALWLIWLSAA